MGQARTLVLAKLVVAISIVFATLLFLPEPEHAHSEPTPIEVVEIGSDNANFGVDDDWISGHCHGGPSCTGAMYLSETVRAHVTDGLARNAFDSFSLTLLGATLDRDPPIPIYAL